MKRALLSFACVAVMAMSLPIPHASAAPRDDGMLDGFGTNIPFSFAVRQIVPEGYVVHYGPGVDQRAKVSWNGGANWRSVLEATARAKGLGVSFQGQTVRIGNPAAVANADRAYDGGGAVAVQQPQSRAGFVIVPYRAPEPMPMPAPVAPPMQMAQAPMPAPAVASPPVPVAPIAVAAPQVPVAPAPPPVQVVKEEEIAPPVPVRQVAPPVPDRIRPDTVRHQMPVKVTIAPGQENFVAGGKWHAAQGDTLDQVLGDWAEKGGWHLVYNSRMIYTLQAPADFDGNFLDAASALVTSVEAHPRPMAVFHKGNSTLVIDNAIDQVN